jgi:hypothetical protein
VSANHCVYSVENASPVLGKVPESNSLAPAERDSQKNSPDCRYLSNAPRLLERLIREQSGGLFTTLEGWQFVLITRGSKPVQRNVSDPRVNSGEMVSRFRFALEL